MYITVGSLQLEHKHRTNVVAPTYTLSAQPFRLEAKAGESNLLPKSLSSRDRWALYTARGIMSFSVIRPGDQWDVSNCILLLYVEDHEQ